MSRAGKPCAGGSGSSFIFTAIIGSRSGSMTQAVGIPAVQPSTDRPTSCVALDETPASSSTSRSRTPVHLALPTSRPPTSLLTQAIVTYCSNIGRPTSSSQVRVVSRSTRPWMRSVQVAMSTDGVSRAVSMR